MYTSHATLAAWNGVTSGRFLVKIWVKQGSLLSPVLFCLYMDVLLNLYCDQTAGHRSAIFSQKNANWQVTFACLFSYKPSTSVTFNVKVKYSNRMRKEYTNRHDVKRCHEGRWTIPFAKICCQGVLTYPVFKPIALVGLCVRCVFVCVCVCVRVCVYVLVCVYVCVCHP